MRKPSSDADRHLASHRPDMVSLLATNGRTRRMQLLARISLPLFALLLAACATGEAPSTTASSDRKDAVGRSKKKQLDFRLASGTYRCELGQSVEVERRAHSDRAIELRWQGRQHTLQRQASSSGLPRYEDRQNGLLWIDLPWKSVLMDAHSGRPLANECKPASSRTASG
ncbi:MAG TPA: MliC family protein [Candidatus Accumulibacter phosphatis]|nr:MAG: Membrane-bound lysozyme-inhibitor of c-type lysozyme [Candidatus Accumulibacter sp. SK-11]HRL76618.1 MliC family protein [Candidatus Accumulibacter phosphatis]HRQ94270.1 MliC family protein [Candidatus Accumulibacter phosphatis]